MKKLNLIWIIGIFFLISLTSANAYTRDYANEKCIWHGDATDNTNGLTSLDTSCTANSTTGWGINIVSYQTLGGNMSTFGAGNGGYAELNFSLNSTCQEFRINQWGDKTDMTNENGNGGYNNGIIQFYSGTTLAYDNRWTDSSNSGEFFKDTSGTIANVTSSYVPINASYQFLNGTNISVSLLNGTNWTRGLDNTVGNITGFRVYSRFNTNGFAVRAPLSNITFVNCSGSIAASDTTKPIINTSLNISLNSIKRFSVININGNATDETALSGCRIVTNQTGSNVFFNYTMSGTADKCSQNLTINTTRGWVINVSIVVNDSSNNLKTNSTVFTVADTLGSIRIGYNLTSSKINDVLNISGNATDFDSDFSQGVISYNISGNPQLNFSFDLSNSGIFGNFSRAFTLNLTRGNVINFTVFTNSTNGTIYQNSTLVTIENTPPPSTSVSNASGLFRNSNLTLNITLAIDADGDTINYSVLFDIINPPTVKIANYSTTNFTTNITADGTYFVRIDTSDGVNITQGTSIFNVSINSTLLTPTQNAPANGTAKYSSELTMFSFTTSRNASCNIVFDNSIIYTNGSTNTSQNSFIYSTTKIGTFTWYTNCSDIYGNLGNSSFIISFQQPVAGSGSTGGGGGGGGGGDGSINPLYLPPILPLALTNTSIQAQVQAPLQQLQLPISMFSTGNRYLDIGIPLPFNYIIQSDTESIVQWKYFAEFSQTSDSNFRIKAIRVLPFILIASIIIILSFGKIAFAFARISKHLA